ncbi:hypothetical protein [Tissierella praeacuta]|uniref:hypothetical protein n=1 Tax=Tissierella praeacuta TaxID=43131 RepID=UPI0033401186
MLKRKFEIKDVIVSDTIPEEIYSEISSKLIEYSIGIWGDISPGVKKHNKEVLKLREGVIIGSYMINNYTVYFFTDLDTKQTLIIPAIDLIIK